MYVKVFNYVPELIRLGDADYTQYLDDLTEELSANQPKQWMIRASIENATKPFVADPNRDQSFQKLLDFDLRQLSCETANHVFHLLPCPIDDISIHILPAIESKGGGCCYAPGKFLLGIRCDELAPMRLKRNIAHEYSHTVRYTQEALIDSPNKSVFPSSKTMRGYLAYEGLAMVLGDSLYPHPGFPPYEVSAESEAAFWEKIDLDASGTDAYIRFMTKRAYEISSRIVSSYIAKHEISIVEAHSRTDKELYWKSGYPFIR
ncbi:hypothetical protein [Paenibacillus sp. GCM10012303]|uniref:hypothetical protein n=1 Tax=Paenibacillus sp. GCM10012303 TaxID=3317340 RepID=UPI003608ADF6